MVENDSYAHAILCSLYFYFDVKHAWLASDFTDLRYGSRHGRGWYECDARREPRIFFQKIMGQQAYG